MDKLYMYIFNLQHFVYPASCAYWTCWNVCFTQIVMHCNALKLSNYILWNLDIFLRLGSCILYSTVSSSWYFRSLSNMTLLRNRAVASLWHFKLASDSCCWVAVGSVTSRDIWSLYSWTLSQMASELMGLAVVSTAVSMHGTPPFWMELT